MLRNDDCSDMDQIVRAKLVAEHYDLRGGGHRTGGEALDNYLTPDEAMLRLEQLSDAQWRKINRVALALTQSVFDAQDLRQKVILSVAEGERQWPVGLPAEVFFHQAIRSLLSAMRKSWARKNNVALELVDDAEINMALGTDPGAERILIGREEAERIKASVLSLFDDDPTTRLLMEGIMAGMEGGELSELAGIDGQNLATRRRLIKRRIAAAYPEGWHHGS